MRQLPSRYNQYTPLLCNQVEAFQKISKGEIIVNLSKPPPMKSPPKRGPYYKFLGAKGHHTNDCIVLCDTLKAKARKGNLDALFRNKEKPKPIVEAQNPQTWYEEVMKQQADVNVIITKLDASSPVETGIDYETDPLEFHRINMGLDAKSDVDPVAEDSRKSDTNNADHSLNTLYDIGTPQDSQNFIALWKSCPY